MTIYQEMGDKLRDIDGKAIEIAFDYGKESQHRILAEECVELAKEALKGIRGDYRNGKEILDECGDVLLMLMQICHLRNFSFLSVLDKAVEKADRQISRHREETKDSEPCCRDAEWVNGSCRGIGRSCESCYSFEFFNDFGNDTRKGVRDGND